MTPETEIHEMKEQLEDLANSMVEMKGTMSQIKEAIMGNPVSNDGGMNERLKRVEKKIEMYERMKWIVIGAALMSGFSLGELIQMILRAFDK